MIRTETAQHAVTWIDRSQNGKQVNHNTTDRIADWFDLNKQAADWLDLNKQTTDWCNVSRKTDDWCNVNKQAAHG